MRKSEKTRQDILKSAVAIFAEKGYAASTTREIAEKAGVSEATLFKHFKSKKGLLHQAVLAFMESAGQETAFRGLDEILEREETLGTRELLEALFLDRYEFLSRHFPMIKILLIEMQYHEDVRESCREQIGGRILIYARKLAELLERRDDVRKDMDLLVVIRSFMGMVLLAAVQNHLLPGLTGPPQGRHEEMAGMIDLFMKGIERGEGV